MNSLDREIKEGEEVVVKARYLKQGVDPIFICEAGFGMASFTHGSAIMGYWKTDKEKDRIEGYMIDPKATQKYHEGKE